MVGLLIIWLDVKPIITTTITINKINHITLVSLFSVCSYVQKFRPKRWHSPAKPSRMSTSSASIPRHRGRPHRPGTSRASRRGPGVTCRPRSHVIAVVRTVQGLLERVEFSIPRHRGRPHRPGTSRASRRGPGGTCCSDHRCYFFSVVFFQFFAFNGTIFTFLRTTYRNSGIFMLQFFYRFYV